MAEMSFLCGEGGIILRGGGGVTVEELKVELLSSDVVKASGQDASWAPPQGGAWARSDRGHAGESRLLVGLVTHQASPREAGGSGEEDERSRIIAFSVLLIRHLLWFSLLEAVLYLLVHVYIF